MIEFAIYLLTGAIVGFFAGLLGIGGGLILVPIFSVVFANYLGSSQLVHLAIGTSLATILVTSLAAVKTHQSHKAVRWDIVKQFTPGIFVGGILGAWIAQFMDASILSKTFAVLELVVGIKILANFQPNPQRKMPNFGGTFFASSSIGTLSALVGISGGVLNTPYMIWHNIKIKQAIATSAALSLPVALAGTIGFIWSGWGIKDLPDYSIGYVYLPAFLGIVLTSYFTAPIGAKLTYRLPVKSIKNIFAGLLILLALKMFLF